MPLRALVERELRWGARSPKPCSNHTLHDRRSPRLKVLRPPHRASRHGRRIGGQPRKARLRRSCPSASTHPSNLSDSSAEPLSRPVSPGQAGVEQVPSRRSATFLRQRLEPRPPAGFVQQRLRRALNFSIIDGVVTTPAEDLLDRPSCLDIRDLPYKSPTSPISQFDLQDA